MTYTALLRACGGDADKASATARTAALLPLFSSDPAEKEVRHRLRSRSALFAALLKVPRRVLKRWATRALASLPRSKRVTGPRRNNRFLICMRRLTRRRSKRLVSTVKRGGTTT